MKIELEKEKLIEMLLGTPCDHCDMHDMGMCVDCNIGVSAWVEEHFCRGKKEEQHNENQG